MNRETENVEYRGRRKYGSKKWVFGHGFLIDNATPDNPVFVYSDERITWVEVIPETVGQYIGLTDGKGNKMFEGDILKDGKGQYGKIFYRQHGFAVNWKMRNGSWETDECFSGNVVGNIHDNPELLEANND